MSEQHENDQPATEQELDRPLFSDEGVDLTLIRMMREKTPAERLRWLNDAANAVSRLRRARRVTSSKSH